MRLNSCRGVCRDLSTGSACGGCRAYRACSARRGWGRGRNRLILNDQVVENQWSSGVVGRSVLDIQMMWPRGQLRSLEGHQTIVLDRRIVGSNLNWVESPVIDAKLGHGIYSAVRIEGDCCYPCYLDTCTIFQLLKEMFEATSGAHQRNQKSS